MYNSFHVKEVYRVGKYISEEGPWEVVTVVGNICVTGDILARDSVLPKICEGDVLCVLDAGAYGYSMCSNYNNRLRPAEVMIGQDGEPRLIRRRETLDDLLTNFPDA